MSKHTFKEGDLVVLKSGGPNMTIANIEPLGAIHCDWFDGKKHYGATFQAHQLIVAPPEEEPGDMIAGINH